MKTCKRCSKTDNNELFIKGKNTCKECHKIICKERYEKNKPIKEEAKEKPIITEKECKVCNQIKKIELFPKNRNSCSVCWNITRSKQRYNYIDNAKDITKTCINCNKESNGNNFTYGRDICKPCERNILFVREKEYNSNTDLPDKTCTNCKRLLSSNNFRYQENSCYDCEKDRLYKWRINNPDKFKAICQRQRSKPDYREKNNKYKREKYNSDDNDKIGRKYRQLVRESIKGNRKDIKTIEDIIGSDIYNFKNWLSYNFTDDMTWENYGTYWQIDHIIPCNIHNLSDDNELKECFNWSNMVPIKPEDNQKKFNKLDEEMIKYYQEKAINFEIINMQSTSNVVDSLADLALE